MTTTHMLRHVISVDPCQPSWLKTQADSHYGKFELQPKNLYWRQQPQYGGLVNMPVIINSENYITAK